METVALQVARFLEQSGIEQVFTVTGGGAMFLNKAFSDVYGEEICYMHHEQACAMAAEGYARIAEKPAIVNVTTGPGAINAMNGVFGAFTDSIPMVIISGQVKNETLITSYGDQNLRQLGDQEARVVEMARPICKYAVSVTADTDLEVELPKAVCLATSGRPGPVWIDIPTDIQMSLNKISFQNYELASEVEPTDSEKVAALIEGLLASSVRPIILAGTGVRLSDSVDELLAFSEKNGIPIATAWTHDIIESESPYFAGRPGTIGTRPGNFCLQNADLVFVLGSRLNIRQTSFNWDSFAKGAVIIHVDIDKSELNKFYLHSDYKLQMDLADFFSTVHELRRADEGDPYRAWRDWCREISHKYNVKNEAFRPASEGKMNPYLAVMKISDALSQNSVIVCGNASACIIPFQCVEIKKGQRMFSNSGSASMGYDLPAAVGARIAMDNNDKGYVACFAGDGSMQMNIQELQTIMSKNLNIKIFLINNNGYLSIKSTHENFFNTVFGADPETGIDFPDFCNVAGAYGISSHRFTSIEDLDAISEILCTNGPALIELVVDPDQEFCPKLKSRMGEDGNFITPDLDDMYPFLPEELIDEVRKSAKDVGGEEGR